MRNLRFLLALLLLVGCADAAEEEPGDPYQVLAFDKTVVSSLGYHPNFQRARAEIDLGKGPFERATLVVELESPCFPFSKWRVPGAIPTGHLWPAACDAFDRTFSIRLLPKEEGRPALELVRAITPFGGPMQFEVDVTDVANGLPGEHEIEVYIGTWPDPEGRVSGSEGRWFVSAHLEMVPGTPPREVLAVVPLFSGDWKGPALDRIFSYELKIPKGAKTARLEYRATGHGGGRFDPAVCVGPAEEFCRRKHGIYLGREPLFEGEPWVSCDDNCQVVANDPQAPFAYCAQNPCANHESARAPRANWCPGQLVPPIVLDDPLLTRAGKQAVSWRLDEIADGGLWTVSATYFAFK